MVPDFDTLRPVAWHEKTALCLADLRWSGGAPVVASPRQILRAQLERLAERGLEAFAGTELEFIVFKDTYEEAFEKGYSGLRPANQYNVDYSLLGTARVEPLIGRIRREMTAAGLVVERLQGRVQRRPARDQLPLRAGAADRRRARDLQDRARRRSRRSRAWRSRSWPSSTSARAPRATSTSRCGATAAFATTSRLRPLRGGPARLPARADAASTRRTSTPTSASRPARSRPPRWPGGATTARARCASSATATRCGSSCGCRARTSTRTWRSAR